MSIHTVRLPGMLSSLRLPGKEQEKITIAASKQASREREKDILHEQIAYLEQEVHQTREEAYNQGFEDGLTTEREKHQQHLKAHAQQFRELAGKLEESYSESLANMEEPLLRMSLTIAEKILRHAIPEELKREGLVSAIRSFLKEVIHEGEVVIRVAPSEYGYIQSEEVSENLGHIFPGRMRFVADDSLESGECQVETPEHILDGSYGHQLEILEQSMT